MKKILLIMTGFSLILQAEFVRNNASVADTHTGLVWQDDADAANVEKNWSDAKAYCSELSLEGKSDWRLPSMKELLSITDKNRSAPAIVPGFKNVTPNVYWSSSVDQSDSKNAWYVGFKSGFSRYNAKTRTNRVRCVREGQSLDTLSFDAHVNRLVKVKLSEAALKDPRFSLEKDMFETEAEFNKRVNAPDFVTKISHLKNEAIKEAIETSYGRALLSNLKYDAENAYFVGDLNFEAKKDFKQQKVAITIPKNIAREFYASAQNLSAEAVFEVNTNGVSLKRIEVPFQNKNYLAQFTDKDIDNARVAMEISGLKGLSLGQSEVSTFDTNNLKSFDDLDKLLATAPQAKSDKTKWLFVIGIEQYQYTDNISYAKRSAEMFVKAAQKTLGVPKENSYVMLNDKASQAEIKTGLKKMLRRVQTGDSIYFYYNGHGVPVPSEKNEPYLLASNTEPDFVQDEKFFSLQNIYSTLSDSKAGKVVAVVDSCFSGVTDAKAVLKGVAATRVVAKRTSFDQEKMVVLSAGKGHQYSNAYAKKGHRLFSFYVMKNLLEGKSDVATLYKEAKAQTYQASLEEYGDLRVQEPTIEGNARMGL